MTSAGDVLKTTRAFVERGWCQGSYARDESGNPVYAESPDAVKWCISGALARTNALPDSYSPARDRAVVEARYLLGASVADSIARWNDRDGRTQEEVLSAIDKAIKLASL